MNQQAPERVQRIPEGHVEVHSVFETIQGEGPFAGTPAVFIRLTGCNLQCPWCDTDYTSNRELLPVSLLASRVGVERWAGTPFDGSGQLVVITGGEPFRQNLGPLVRELVEERGYRVQIETNGTLYDPSFPYELATVVCSPKTPKIAARLVPHLAALKYVLDAKHIDPVDGLPATTMGADWHVYRPSGDFTGEVYVQPLDESGDSDTSEFVENYCNRVNLAAAVASAMKFGYRLCIQTHKLTNLP